MAATLDAATFMGKNFSTIQSFVKNFEDLTLKQMFDVTAQLVNDQEEIHRFDKIQWEKCSWRRLSLIGDETVINLQSTKVYVFSDSVLCLGGVLQHPDCNEGWRNRVTGIKSGKSYRDFEGINGESTEFEANIFPGFTTLQLCDKISDPLSDLEQTPETFTGRILFMSMFNDIFCDRKSNKDECLANAGFVKVLARRFGVGQWSHGPRLYVCQAPKAPVRVSRPCSPKHQMRLYVCHQMRLYVCHQMRLYVCHQMRLYVCHQMRLLNPQRSSLRSLTFARFARTFFNRLNSYLV